MPEGRLRKEFILLPKNIQLGIPVEDTGWNKLIEDAYNEWGKDCEHYIIQCKRPWLESDLSREIVNKWVLQQKGNENLINLSLSTENTQRTMSYIM